jgi:hypothetical protein
MTWVNQIFEADAARNGGVVRRSRASVDRFATMGEFVAEAKLRRFHVIETGGQIVVLCHDGEMVVHC